MDFLKSTRAKQGLAQPLVVITTVLACACVLALSACSRSGRLEARNSYAPFIQPPTAPPVVITPAAFLLTNYPAFSARLVNEGVRPVKGYIFGKGTTLAFIPDPEKKGPSGQFSFIWDTVSNSGYVISEALQGYAPLTLRGMGVATNAHFETGPDGKSRTLSAALDNGRRVEFTAQSDGGPKGFPTLISGGSPQFKTQLTRISLASPKPSLFSLPPDFTKYESPEAMVDELSTRYRNFKRRVFY